jgi:predicted DNA binding CopG/RHH family protein
MRLKKARSTAEFRTETEEAEFWSTHETSEIWKDAKPVRPLKMPEQQVQAIKQRASERKAAISIRLDRSQIEAAKRIAGRKSIGYQTQLRIWIAEAIRKESSRT